MPGNPFINRWLIEDFEFIKQRKKQWPFVKQHYVSKKESAKAIKQLKLFFLEGEWPNGYCPDVMAFLAWTPSNNIDEIKALFEYLANQPGGDRLISSANYYAALGRGLLSADSPISFALGNEKMIAQAVMHEGYTSEKYYQNDFHETVPFYPPPQEFITHYETVCLNHLTEVDPYIHSPLPYSFDFYLSCIRYMEDNEQEVHHHEHFDYLISVVFNFVEGGQTNDKPRSKVAEYAELLRTRFTQAEMPNSVKSVVKELGPNNLLEYSRDASLGAKIRLGSSLVNHPKLSTPRARVLRGISHNEAFRGFWFAGQNANLIPIGSEIPNVEQVDISSLISDELVMNLGCKVTDVVPAYRLGIWYQPKVRIANSYSAGFGAELIFILPKDSIIKDDTTSVIYYPRLNSYYQHWIPSSVLFLKERQVRRAIWEETHKHLLMYDDDWCKPLSGEFMDSAYLEVGFYIFRDLTECDIDSSMKGPSVKVWKGETLPELNLEEALYSGDS